MAEYSRVLMPEMSFLQFAQSMQKAGHIMQAALGKGVDIIGKYPKALVAATFMALGITSLAISGCSAPPEPTLSPQDAAAMQVIQTRLAGTKTPTKVSATATREATPTQGSPDEINMCATVDEAGKGAAETWQKKYGTRPPTQLGGIATAIEIIDTDGVIHKYGETSKIAEYNLPVQVGSEVCVTAAGKSPTITPTPNATPRPQSFNHAPRRTNNRAYVTKPQGRPSA